MISSTSLFNLGIYKNTLRRFKWGSFLYFVILFFSLPFVFLVQNPADILQSYSRNLAEYPLLLRDEYILIPLLLAISVPTITSALSFNNVHSSKQSIFVHSLPVTRKENYISTLAASLTLMAVPVVLVALILFVMSLTAYSQIFTSMSVLYWLGINFSIIFIMFSVSAFSAVLTGNTAAHIVINIFLHIIPMLAALTIYLISDIFLFGFYESGSFIGTTIMNNTPIVWLFGRALSHYNNELNMFAQPQMCFYLGGAIVFYILAYLLYKKRKLETCGDVAAFKIFKPILKYSVTTAAAVAAFGVLSSSEIGAAAIFTVAITVTLIVYFAAEMLMNKTFKVFSKYKGYLAFAACSALFISFFAFTNVFGYETKIPYSEDIESAAVFSNWQFEYPVTQDTEAIESVRSIHREFISDISVTEPDNPRSLRVLYNLKNGKTLERRYQITDEQYKAALSEMFKFPEYKNKFYGLNKINIENVSGMFMSAHSSNYGHSVAVGSDSSELLAAVEKDISILSYDELIADSFPVTIELSFDLTAKENQLKNVFDESLFGENPDPNTVQAFSININSNFTNTFEFLAERGYYEEMAQNLADNLYICTLPVYADGENYTYKNDTGLLREFSVSSADCTRLSYEDAMIAADMLFYQKGTSEMKDGKNYLIYASSQGAEEKFPLRWFAACYSADKLPEIFKKYITQ
ncbi:MAG: hypothetical protein J6C82_05875 [Clostridia bacterium]|nr:hypothetical protein [Clostridia bacterium]